MLKQFIEARDLLKNNGWCQNSPAISVLNFSVPSKDIRASKWCMTGVCEKVSYSVCDLKEMRYLLSQSLENLYGEDYVSKYEILEDWNDSEDTKQGDVIEVFDDVINNYKEN